MLLTTPSSAESKETLTEFLESIGKESRLRVETDLGDGFVRLRSSEAERRQAAQDIRSSEDIVIELLRNSRDAGAHTIFLALQKDEDERRMVCIDDGGGIEPEHHQHIFEPRVTSKLDTAHQDKWGMHGRGMALYSISVNSKEAAIITSAPAMGTSIGVTTELSKLPEKTDQSTFPVFEEQESGAFAMRGPKNIIRTAAEFSLEERNLCTLYCGSMVEIAATLYHYALATTSAALRAFTEDSSTVPLIKRLALAATPEDLANEAHKLGLELSDRSARRILNKEIKPLDPLLERLRTEGFKATTAKKKARSVKPGNHRRIHLSENDKDELSRDIQRLFSSYASRYFLDPDVEVEIKTTADALIITVPTQEIP